MQQTYQDIFSHCSIQFLNSLILMLFSSSAVFCFTSSTSAKHFPLRTFFIRGNKQTNKSDLEKDWVNREEGHRGHVVFGQKLLNTPCGVDRCAHKLPIMKWVLNVLKSFQKDSLKPNTASHNNASWCTDTDRFLEHSPSRGSLYYKGLALQKIILVYFGPLMYFQFSFIFFFDPLIVQECVV